MLPEINNIINVEETISLTMKVVGTPQKVIHTQ